MSYEEDLQRSKRLEGLGVKLEPRQYWTVWGEVRGSQTKERIPYNWIDGTRVKYHCISFPVCTEAIETAIVKLGWKWDRTFDDLVRLLRTDKAVVHPDIEGDYFKGRLEALDALLKKSK